MTHHAKACFAYAKLLTRLGRAPASAHEAFVSAMRFRGAA